jgi:hypothetical protein
VKEKKTGIPHPERKKPGAMPTEPLLGSRRGMEPNPEMEK